MDKLLGFAIRLGREVARPNAVAALFLAVGVVAELTILVQGLQGSDAALPLAVVGFCAGGYAGSLWANWGGGERN